MEASTRNYTVHGLYQIIDFTVLGIRKRIFIKKKSIGQKIIIINKTQRKPHHDTDVVFFEKGGSYGDKKDWN